MLLSAIYKVFIANKKCLSPDPPQIPLSPDPPDPPRSPAITSTEFAGALQYFMPGQDDDYDSGFGAEAQIRFWHSPLPADLLAGRLTIKKQSSAIVVTREVAQVA